MPLLQHLGREVLPHVAFFLATFTVSGPPFDLVSLILTNRFMHDALCACRSENAHLYGDIFIHNFDLVHVRRRFGPTFAYSSCLSAECRDRFSCLTRIRRRDYRGNRVRYLTSDLVRCYFMLLEHETKNCRQLFQYARLYTFLLELASQYLPYRGSPTLQSATVSILLWLILLVSSRENLFTESDHVTNDLRRRLAPYIVMSFLYHDYPPVASRTIPSASINDPNDRTPSRFTFSYLSHNITFSPPPIVPAAILVDWARSEAQLLRHSTASEGRARSERLLSAWSVGLDTDTHGGERFDDHWVRLNILVNGFCIAGGVATMNLHRLLANISAQFEGCMQIPDHRVYMSLLNPATRDNMDTNDVFMTGVPLYCRLRAYYCTNPADVLPLQQDRDGVLNAWLPPSAEVEMSETAHGDLRIWRRATNTRVTYQRFYADQFDSTLPIHDIIIIGTSEFPLSSGLEATYRGRVRISDGLILLHRNGPQAGSEVLRGHMHDGRTLVGVWRAAASPADANSWEGPFVMSRMNEI